MIDFFRRLICIVKGWFTPEHKEVVPTKLIDPLDLELECKYCDYEETITIPQADYRAWHNGKYIQDAFPYLTDGQRELMLSNTCDTCWDKFFPE